MFFSLNGSWKINHIPFASDLSDILQENFVPEGWLNANVPEQVHAVLRRHGHIAGHTYNKDAASEKWIEEQDWIYYKEFFAPEQWSGQSLFLSCCGLDTFCDIYVNGILLGRHQNMFTTFRSDISSVLKYQARNVVVIRFFSPTNFVKDMDQKGIFSITTSERIFARKAQMNYSWDFCGRTVTTGIWKDIGIEVRKEAAIDSYYVYTESISNDQAEIVLDTKTVLPDSDNCEYRIQIRLSKDGSDIFTKAFTPEEALHLTFSVTDPVLWWPRPYGSAQLYDLELALLYNDQTIDYRKQKFGIRTVELIQERQEDGISFQFCVNGKRIFVRGANWVPMRMVYSDIKDTDYDLFLEYAARGDISMLRIWGGGIYENDRFFERCDELGIMVWSDFMFSCGIYPQHHAFLEEVRKEAEEIVVHYRNFTSLVLWAGDNEIGQAYGWAGRPYEFQNDKIGPGVLKEICETLDPKKPYLTTSPCSPDETFKGGDNPSSPYQGDQHIYIMSADPGVNEYRDYGKDYYKRILGIRPRFMSEFGFVGLPEKDTFYSYNFRREPLRRPEELMSHFPAIRPYIESGDSDRMIYYAQLFTSLALKYWMEYFRSLKGICNGTLYWKFNDPVADCPDLYFFPSHMSTVDMYAHPKMTYYYTRRAYSDFLLALREEDEGLSVYACNELEKDINGTLTVEELDYNGTVYWNKKLDCCAKADSSTLLSHLDLTKYPDEIRLARYIRICFHSADGIFLNRYYYADIIECDRLTLPPAQLTITGIQKIAEKTVSIRLKTDSFVRNVRLNILDCHADYSDNYFDLDAGSDKEVTIQLLPMQKEDILQDHLLYIEGENIKRVTAALYPLL